MSRTKSRVDSLFDFDSISDSWRDSASAEWVSPNCENPRVVEVKKTIPVAGDPTVFGKQFDGYIYRSCNRCASCDRRKVIQKAARTHNEAIYAHNLGLPIAFCTLTIDDDHMTFGPDGRPVLDGEVFTGFMKRLRSNIDAMPDNLIRSGDVRFVAVGEYGDKTGRPHWHIFFFGFPPCDNGTTRGDLMKVRLECCWQCRLIQRSWAQGNIRLEVVRDPAAAARYVVGYMLKDMLSGAKHLVPPVWRSSRHLGHAFDVQVGMRLKETLEKALASDLAKMSPEEALARQVKLRAGFRKNLIEGKSIPYAGRGQLSTIMHIAGQTAAERESNLHDYYAAFDASDRRRHMSGMSVSDVTDAVHKTPNASRDKRNKIKGRPV